MIELPRYLEEVCIRDDSKKNSYEIKPEAKVLEPIFIRSNVVLNQKIFDAISFISISWLTISQAIVTFINVHFRCKIQVTAKSQIIAENCTFRAFDERCECIIEIFANSFAIFKKCNFIGSNKAGVAVRDRSVANFTDCTFEDSSNTSLLVLDKSRANIDRCVFKSADRFSIYLYRNSISMIKNSQFLSQKGKALFMLTGCQAHVINCRLNQCQGGGISIADSSDVYVDLCSFSELGSSSVHAMKNSLASVKRSIFRKCRGNGVNFEYSTGYVYKSKFNNFDYPAIACFGPKATPVIFRSKIKNCNSMAIVSRDCSAPIFSKLKICNVKSNGFSISDFSDPLIENCILKKIQKIPFCVYNGSTSIIKNCIIQYNSNLGEKIQLFRVFTNGNVIFGGNKLLSQNNDRFSISANYNGKVDITQFASNFLLNEEKETEIKKGRSLMIDACNNIKVDEDYSLLGESIFINENEEEEENYENYQIGNYYETRTEKEEDDKNDENKCIHGFVHCNSFRNTHGQIPQRLETIEPPSDMPLPLPQIDVSEVMHKKCKCCNHDHKEDDSEMNHIESSLGVCLRCGQNMADQVIVPCGHKVLCKKCASECTTQQPSNEFHHFCPLCDVPIQKCTPEYAEKDCVICLDNKCDAIILPCGHRCICYECAAHLWNEKKQCPLCQTRVLSFRHMFNICSDDDQNGKNKKSFS